MYKLIPLLLAAALVLGGCASQPQWPEESRASASHVISDAPFHPQEAYQCGPAALATMFNHRSVDTTPEKLVDQVYVPERGGSLQVEMVATARAHGLLAYPLEPELTAIVREVEAGNPVLVMQNLGLDWWPQWHYAVVIGYNRGRDRIILHTDTRRRHAEPVRPFLASWERADHWAMVMTPPDHLPATAQPLTWLDAASDLEAVRQLPQAEQAYRTALSRWPDASAARFGLANALYAQGDAGMALSHYLILTRAHPDLEAGWRNLATVLARGSCPVAARSAARCGDQTYPTRPVPDDASLACPVIRCPSTEPEPLHAIPTAGDDV